jgi:O-antigen/teichoic acid export membrane protein
MAKTVASELKVISRHSSIYGLSNILNRIVSFVLLPIYTHYLTPADYGLMDLLYFTTAFIGMVLEMGINSAVSRFYFESEDQTKRNLVVSSAFYGFGVGSTLIVLIFIAGSRYLTELIFKTPDYTHLMIIALAGLALDIYIQAAYTYIRVRQRSHVLMIVSVVRLIMQLTLNILFIVYFKMGVMGILLGTLISNFVLVLYLVPYVLRETGLGFSREKLMEMIKFGLPLIPSNLMAYIVNVSDRYFLNAFTNLSVTGIYTLGYRFGILVNEFVAAPFGQIWIPRRFEYFQKEDSERIFGRIFTYFCLASFFVGLGISVLTKDVIQIISDQAYWGAWKVVPLITLSYIIARFQLHFNIGILAKKKTKYIMYINIFTAVTNLILNYFLIKKYDMWGAAYATLISFMLKTILYYIIGNRLVKIVIEWSRILKIVILSGLLYWSISMIELGDPYLNLIVKGLACLTFPFILYIIKFFYPDEPKEAWNIVRPILRRIWAKLRKKRDNAENADKTKE